MRSLQTCAALHTIELSQHMFREKTLISLQYTSEIIRMSIKIADAAGGHDLKRSSSNTERKLLEFTHTTFSQAVPIVIETLTT